MKDIKARCHEREESNKDTTRSRVEAHASPWGRTGSEGMVIIPLLQVLQNLKSSGVDYWVVQETFSIGSFGGGLWKDSGDSLNLLLSETSKSTHSANA